MPIAEFLGSRDAIHSTSPPPMSRIRRGSTWGDRLGGMQDAKQGSRTYAEVAPTRHRHSAARSHAVERAGEAALPQRAKQSDTRLLHDRKPPSEIGAEFLNAGADLEKVVVGTEIDELLLD